MAILPGVSRSGTTIGLAMILGLRRRWAGEFSFLIGAPAMLGAAVLQFVDYADEAADAPWGPMLAGSLAAFAAGYVALRLLLAVVRRAKLHYFAYYCAGVAGAILLGWV